MKALALLVAIGCAGAPPPSPPELPSAVVRTGSLEDRFMLTGELVATRSDVLRAPRTPNWMISIKWMVDDGAEVKKGDKVLEFDTSSLASALADKRLAAARSESELASEAARNAVTEVDRVLEVERKRVALEKARVEAAVPEDLRPRREHQEKHLAVTKAEDALVKAEGDLAAHRRSARLDTQVKEIALRRARRDLAEIESRLDELAVRAPRDGLVQVSMNYRGESRKFQAGDTAYADVEVARMPDLSVLHVRARLHDVDEGAVKAGMAAACILDAHPERVARGTIASVTPVARTEGRDAVRRVFDVLVTLERTDPEIMRPGMSVRVEAIRRRTEKALLLPRHALRETGGRTFARLRGGQEVPVEVEFCAQQECALRSGPPAGTPVAAAGTTRPAS